MTERQMVLREREAFVRGAGWRLRIWQRALRVDHTQGEDEIAESLQCYPLPKVTRPRVLIDECGMAWKHEDGAFWYSLSARPGFLDWKRNDPSDVIHELTTTRVHLWADLLARPVEQVEVEA